ncbi:LacI family DNA-binding transcriptional regulator [Sulfitobacter aestuarii]|uniref:LacI family DNA-binding transcriptional regulator n=1 Tax=Sulfitobacter aestuarii TaxID=2161676 RepID=A0ABW5TWJ7_9RHOB
MIDRKPDNSRLPTLADVASRVGVSTATVSRCLNEPDRVIGATRERVMAAVRELGYSPNFGARALAARRTNTVGAVIPTMENAIFARGLQAFQEELGENGITLLVASSSYRADLEEEQIRTLAARGADGMLLIGYDRDPAIYSFLKRQGIPVVIAWAHDPRAGVASVGFDNYRAMKALAHAVISRGHSSLGIVSARQAGNDRARERVRGIVDAAAQAGLGSDRVHIVETSYGIDEGAQAFEALMSRENRPSAVMCGNDVLAVGAIGRARELGLDVPLDVSVTGFDDMELAKLSFPPLTTIHVPHRRMGQEAARLLMSTAKTGSENSNILLETEIRLRGSLA